MSAYPTFLNENLYQYLLTFGIRESKVLAELREASAKLSQAAMQISPEEGQLLQILIKISNAKKILEIGTFTGYSTLAMASALPEDGFVYTCDIDPNTTQMAQKFWQQANLADKITLFLDPAENTLKKLLQDGMQESFDFVFIDADKENNNLYYEYALKLIRKKGLIAIDNIFWDGRVCDPSNQQASTIAIKALNEKIHRDDRVEMVMIPVGDGVTLALKK